MISVLVDILEMFKILISILRVNMNKLDSEE